MQMMTTRTEIDTLPHTLDSEATNENPDPYVTTLFPYTSARHGYRRLDFSNRNAVMEDTEDMDLTALHPYETDLLVTLAKENHVYTRLNNSKRSLQIEPIKELIEALEAKTMDEDIDSKMQTGTSIENTDVRLHMETTTEITEDVTQAEQNTTKNTENINIQSGMDTKNTTGNTKAEQNIKNTVGNAQAE